MLCLSSTSEDGQRPKEGCSECYATLSEPYGIDSVGASVYQTKEIKYINLSTLLEYKNLVRLVLDVWGFLGII
jgi:hypothetical protein